MDEWMVGKHLLTVYHMHSVVQQLNPETSGNVMLNLLCIQTGSTSQTGLNWLVSVPTDVNRQIKLILVVVSV